MIETAPRASEQPRTRWTPVVVIFLVAAVMAVLGFAAMFLLGGDDPTPTEVAEDLAAAVRDGDEGRIEELVAHSGERRFYRWLVSVEAAPVFSNCAEDSPRADGSVPVACDVAFGETFFYSRVLDTTLTTTVSGVIDTDGRWSGSNFPPPAEVVPAELELKRWVQRNRPELVDDMFSSGVGLRFTEEAGAMHMDILEDYLAAIR